MMLSSDSLETGTGSSNSLRSTIQSAFPLWRNMSLVMAQVVGRSNDPRIADRFGDRVTDSRPIVALDRSGEGLRASYGGRIDARSFFLRNRCNWGFRRGIML